MPPPAPQTLIPTGHASLSDYRYWILALSMMAGGLCALWFGFAIEWDWLNYHIYNPHALLNGRLDIDVAPAQLQSFLNPALHLPTYLLYFHLGPEATVFVIGAVQAGQAFLLLLLIREIAGERIREWYYLAPAALLGLGGPIFLNQLGSSQGDTLLSFFVLGALLLTVRDLKRSDGDRTFRSGLVAGTLLGVAGALKLTMLLFALGLGVSAFLCFSGRRRWQLTAGMALGGILGLLIAGGPWFYYEWQKYGNPLLPYFNNLFESDWVGPSSHRDRRFLPQGLTEWVLYPWVWFMDAKSVWEYEFRDIRMPLMISAAFVLPIVGWRKMRNSMPALGMVWLFVLVSYLLWLALFSIYRYLSVLELIAPLVLLCSWALFSKSRISLLIALALLAWTQFEVEFHRNSGTGELTADTPTVLAGLGAESMVITGGYHPVAYVAMWIPDKVPFVRFRSNFMMKNNPPLDRMHQFAHDRIRSHEGPIYLLMSEWERDKPFYATDFAGLGLAPPAAGECENVFESDDLQQRLRLLLCRLEFQAPADRQPHH